MTRSEFIGDVESFGDLKDFTYDNDLSWFTEDIYDDDERDEYIDNWVSDAIRYDRWYDIRDTLDDISSNYDWYRIRGIHDIEGLDDSDFYDVKDKILAYCDENDIFDPEEDDEDEDEEEDDDYDPFDGQDYSKESVTLDPEEYRGLPDTDEEFNEFIGVVALTPINQ